MLLATSVIDHSLGTVVRGCVLILQPENKDPGEDISVIHSSSKNGLCSLRRQTGEGPSQDTVNSCRKGVSNSCGSSERSVGDYNTCRPVKVLSQLN